MEAMLADGSLADVTFAVGGARAHLCAPRHPRSSL